MTTLPVPSPVAGSYRLEGGLDLYAAERLHSVLRECLAPSATTVVLDLGGVSSCDAAGIQLLLSAQATATATGRAASFVSVPEAVDRCCDQLGLPHLR